MTNYCCNHFRFDVIFFQVFNKQNNQLFKHRFNCLEKMSYYMPDLDCSSITPQLHHLSNDELKQLLNDENNQTLDQMIKDLKQV
jgi:hypothetical protein